MYYDHTVVHDAVVEGPGGALDEQEHSKGFLQTRISPSATLLKASLKLLPLAGAVFPEMPNIMTLGGSMV